MMSRNRGNGPNTALLRSALRVSRLNFRAHIGKFISDFTKSAGYTVLFAWSASIIINQYAFSVWHLNFLSVASSSDIIFSGIDLLIILVSHVLPILLLYPIATVITKFISGITADRHITSSLISWIFVILTINSYFVYILEEYGSDHSLLFTQIALAFCFSSVAMFKKDYLKNRVVRVVVIAIGSIAAINLLDQVILRYTQQFDRHPLFLAEGAPKECKESSVVWMGADSVVSTCESGQYIITHRENSTIVDKDSHDSIAAGKEEADRVAKTTEKTKYVIGLYRPPPNLNTEVFSFYSDISTTIFHTGDNGAEKQTDVQGNLYADLKSLTYEKGVYRIFVAWETTSSSTERIDNFPFFIRSDVAINCAVKGQDTVISSISWGLDYFGKSEMEMSADPPETTDPLFDSIFLKLRNDICLASLNGHGKKTGKQLFERATKAALS